MIAIEACYAAVLAKLVIVLVEIDLPITVLAVLFVIFNKHSPPPPQAVVVSADSAAAAVRLLLRPAADEEGKASSLPFE